MEEVAFSLYVTFALLLVDCLDLFSVLRVLSRRAPDRTLIVFGGTAGLLLLGAFVFQKVYRICQHSSMRKEIAEVYLKTSMLLFLTLNFLLLVIHL